MSLWNRLVYLHFLFWEYLELSIVRAQLDERRQVAKIQQQEVEERKTEALRLEARVQELEEQLLEDSHSEKKVDTKLWKEENFQLRLKVKQSEINAEQERSLRLKVTEDCTSLVRENAMLGSQVLYNYYMC